MMKMKLIKMRIWEYNLKRDQVSRDRLDKVENNSESDDQINHLSLG